MKEGGGRDGERGRREWGRMDGWGMGEGGVGDELRGIGDGRRGDGRWEKGG